MTHFYSVAELSDRVEKYFLSVAGQPVPEAKLPAKYIKKTSPLAMYTPKTNKPEVPLLTGLALFLGFPSLADFEAYEQTGLFKKTLREARLRIECEYEKKLHQPAPTGAIFALRCMGWTEKSSARSVKAAPSKLKISVINTGPQIAGTEKEVDI